jgi:ACS family hexuronate transporter-like MFS transporter
MWVMLLCALVMPLSAFVTRMPTLGASITVVMLLVFAHLCWLANISALIVDVIPKKMLATCFGIAAAGSAIGGIAMNEIVAYFVTAHDYSGWYLIMAFLHPVAWLLLLAGGVLRFGPRPPAGEASVMV